MKLNTLSLAVAAACAAAAAPSFASTLAVSQAAIAAGRLIYVSGASASTANVYKGFRSMCDTAADTVDVFTSASGVGSGALTTVGPGETSGSAAWGNFGAYSCKLKVGLTEPDGVTPITLSGQTVVFMHTVAGGAFNSVLPMSSNQAHRVQFLATALAGCANNGTDSNALGDKVFKTCTLTANGANPQSHGGFSDVEAATFKNVFNAQLTPVTNFALADVTVTPANFAQVFGVGISLPLYRAMQTAQGITAATPQVGSVSTVDCTVSTAQAFTGVCQPSITREQYASVVSNNFNSKGHVDWSFLTGGSGVGKVVNLCRRVDTSGTQNSSNMYFLHYPCAGDPDIGGQGSPASIANGDATATFAISEGSSTGNAKTCLNSATNWSAGILSAENIPGSADTWHFVKLDGVAPNEEANNNVSAIQGRYGFVMESVLHTLATVTPAQSKGVLLGVAKRLGDAPTLPILTGLYIVPQPADGAAFTYAGNPTKVGKGTRGYNSCAPVSETN